MKKKYFVYLLILLISYCGDGKSNLKIKVGIVMKSGDIKVVARQDFFVSKIDLVNLWEKSKIQNWRDIKSIEDTVKIEMGYETKIKELENVKAKYQTAINSLTHPKNPEIEKIRGELSVALYTGEYTSMLVNPDLKEIFIKLKNEYRLEAGATSYEEIKTCAKILTLVYKEIIKKCPPVPPKEQLPADNMARIRATQKESWEEVSADLQDKVNGQISNMELKLKTNRDIISKNDAEIINLKNELERRSSILFESYKKKTIAEYRNKISGNIVIVNKTNLNGEASVKINRGNYYLFCVAELASNNILWNLPLEIRKREQYIELSNDNAYSIGNIDLAKELSEAVASLTAKDY